MSVVESELKKQAAKVKVDLTDEQLTAEYLKEATRLNIQRAEEGVGSKDKVYPHIPMKTLPPLNGC